MASLEPDLTAQVDVVTSPLVRIEYVSKPLEMDGVAGVIFTSAHGVHSAQSVPHDRSCPAYCVGQATTQAAADAGWHAQQMGEDAASLIASLLSQNPKGPLLHVRGEHALGDIANTLTERGLRCGEIVMYHQHAQQFSDAAVAAMQGDGRIIAPIFSPRTADLFRQSAPDRPFDIVAMSAKVAREVDGIARWTVATADRPDAGEMRRLVEKLLQTHVPG